MSRILFFDTSNSGHHFYYNLTAIRGFLEKRPDADAVYVSPPVDASQAKELREAGIQAEALGTPGRRLPAVLLRAVQLIALLRLARRERAKRVHLFYLDSLLLPLVLIFPLLWGVKLTATMHWLPSRRSKMLCLQFLLKLRLLERIVVHGDYTRGALLDRSAPPESVVCVHYPNLHPVAASSPESRAQVAAELEGAARPVILCFGGTRHDKGIDLLLSALVRLDDHRFTLVVAGKEEHFTRSAMDALIGESALKHKVRFKLQFIDDAMVSALFEAADLIVLPYRKYFTGQSGPLTEGVVRDKRVVGPSHGEIGHTISAYGLGHVFEAENVGDLARCLSEALQTLPLPLTHAQAELYKSLIDVKTFKAHYGRFMTSERGVPGTVTEGVNNALR